jgi:hypothetical protein
VELHRKSIFIASSDEVKEDRAALADLINSSSDDYQSLGIQLIPLMWEKESKKFESTRKQNRYNTMLGGSDVIVFSLVHVLANIH